jgi:hypothetical protein
MTSEILFGSAGLDSSALVKHNYITFLLLVFLKVLQLKVFLLFL